jgi:hypothetical protein
MLLASTESDADDEDLAERERRVAFFERVAASRDQLRDCIAETALWQTCPGAYPIDTPLDKDEQATGAIADFVRRAIKVTKFFNQVCGPKNGWDRDSDGMHALAVAVQAGFLRDKSPYRAGRERLYEWESDPAAVAAASITVDEAAEHSKQHGPECDLAPKAVEWYAAIVAYRRRLLDIETLAYLAGVEAVAHPNLAAQAHTAVIDLAKVIRSLKTFTGAGGDWAAVAAPLLTAIHNASMFSRSGIVIEPIPTQAPATSPPPAGQGSPSTEDATSKPVRAKRRTEKGEAETKLIAALAKHHQYSDGSCLNPEHVQNNALARLAGVNQASATRFFKKHFRGRRQYVRICADPASLSRILGSLVGDMPAWKLFGRAPKSEGGRAEDE